MKATRRLALIGNRLNSCGSRGGTLIVDLSSMFGGTGNQALTLSGNTLSITGGNSVVLSDNNPTNELQSLSLSANILSISNGNSVNLAGMVSPWIQTSNNTYYNGGNVGIGNITPASKLHVQNGDVYIDDAASGVILKSLNGSCWRVTVDDSGTLASTGISCP